MFFTLSSRPWFSSIESEVLFSIKVKRSRLHRRLSVRPTGGERSEDDRLRAGGREVRGSRNECGECEIRRQLHWDKDPTLRQLPSLLQTKLRLMVYGWWYLQFTSLLEPRSGNDDSMVVFLSWDQEHREAYLFFVVVVKELCNRGDVWTTQVTFFFVRNPQHPVKSPFLNYGTLL